MMEETVAEELGTIQPVGLPRRPAEVTAMVDGGVTTFRYRPTSVTCDDAGARWPSCIEISTRNPVNVDEARLLVTEALDAFLEGTVPDMLDPSLAAKLAGTIEQVHGTLHGPGSLQIESLKLAPPNDEATCAQDTIVSCPVCRAQTRTILPGGFTVREGAPAPVMTVLFTRERSACGHQFIAFVDKTLKARGYETIDM